MWCHYSSILGAPEKQRLNLSVWVGREWCCLAERQPLSLTCAGQLQAGVSDGETKPNPTEHCSSPSPPHIPDMDDGFARELKEFRISPK